MRLLSTILVCAFTISCKSTSERGYSALKSLEGCLKKPNSQSPYNPEILTRELERSIKKLGKDEKTIDLLADFFPRSQIVGFLQGSEESLLDYEKKSCSTVDALDKAVLGLVGSFSFQTGPNLRIWGGAVLFGRDVFPQYQFESRSDQFAMPKEFARESFKEARDFTKGAPWFEWKNDHFEFHDAGATKRVLEIFNQTQKNVTLYRGAGRDTSDAPGILSFRQNSSFFGKDPYDILQGVFFTTSLSSAIKWANPFVISVEILNNDLMRLAEAKVPSLWIGFSRGNLDIAILRNTKNQDTLKLLSSIKKHCQIKSSRSSIPSPIVEEIVKNNDQDPSFEDPNIALSSQELSAEEPPEC